MPGSQPLFQPPVLVPAIRAALALNCEIQQESTFDRKHYFYHDQPAGYQITQYYRPFARDGHITLTAQEGLNTADGEHLQIGIKQVQMEQDTARTQEQDENTSLIDFNRSGHALIEIISLPQLHSPEAAAAYVRKVQSILYAVDAATTGMELGGLRADVNVSVRKLGDNSAQHSYGGVTGLGQRTEIKNLSSFKAVEDAVRAERDRQIAVLESGGIVEGETRGWSLSAPGVTRRLRGKEGEVDYRYMPDPDIPPLYIDPAVVNHLGQSLPPLPQQLLDMLCTTYGLQLEDAKALLSLEDGARLHYYQEVVSHLSTDSIDPHSSLQAAKWVLYELGALLTVTDTIWRPDLIEVKQMADLIALQLNNQITGPSAKRLLRIIFDGDRASVADIVQRENLLFASMTNAEYEELASRVIEEHTIEADIVRQGGKRSVGKLKFLLGQMMRQGDRHRLEAQRAENVLQKQLGSSNVK